MVSLGKRKKKRKERKERRKKKARPREVYFPNQLRTSFDQRVANSSTNRPESLLLFFTLFKKSTETYSSSHHTSKMSGTQYHWTDYLNVPRTEEEWKAFASKAQFELSTKQRTVMINQKKEQLIRQAQNERIAVLRESSVGVQERPKISDHLKRKIHLKATKQVEGLLHWGKHPSEVHMRDLGGWDSASKLRFSWFLTTMILFQFVPVRGTNLFETLAIPNEIRKFIDNYVRGEMVPGAKRDTDIENYLTDIHRYGNEPPESGDATDLGKYTLTRHWQLKMAGSDTPDRAPVDTTEEETRLDQGYYEETDPRYEFIYEEFPKPEDEYSELEFWADDLENQPSAEAEDQTNFPLAALLSSTIMCCNEAKLDWSPIKTDIDIRMGNSRLHAINDGSLRNASGWLLATTEVKRRRLCSLPRLRPRKTMIQMGMELLVHVLDCEQKGIVKDRYVI